MRPRRILMLAPTPYFADRGCHVRIYEEARALKDRGHEVLIVTYHLGRDVGDIPVVRIPNFPWYRKLSAGPSWHKPYLDIFLLYKALAVAAKFKPDIIHAHLHEGAFLAALAHRSFKVPILFDCQGSLCGELLDHGFMKKDGLLHRFFTKLEAWITRSAAHVVTSSTPTAEILRRDFPEISSRLTPLTDAVDTDIFQPLPHDTTLRRTLGIPADKRLIVYLGAMTAYQGVDLLLDAALELSRTRADFHLLLMGYPEETYVDKARQQGLTELVTFTGKLDYAQAPHYLSLGDIAVSPKLSATEANGKLLNYLACGLPCVAFDNRINREILMDVGCYVREREAAAFAREIGHLLDHPEKRNVLAANSRDHAVNNHSWSARIATLEQVYATLVG
ncbi:MAG: glycosyltransferase family 4 protein [Desulfuromonadales bacterium]|nr:glycosyltransferase family 4 protein [Desulfuromonadales bacterium]